MKKKSKKIKDKTPYDPDSSHNFLFFQMVGPNKSCSDFPPRVWISVFLQWVSIVTKKRKSGLYKRQGPWYKFWIMTWTDAPQISVIIPTFNRAWSLARAIDSVLTQTFAPKEIIVVDDGSTDETAQVLAGYGDRIQVLTRPNAGVSSSRNAGICHSTGEWIALLDSDDEWMPEKTGLSDRFFSSPSGSPDLPDPGDLDPQRGPGESHEKASETFRNDFRAIPASLPGQPVRSDDQKKYCLNAKGCSGRISQCVKIMNSGSG